MITIWYVFNNVCNVHQSYNRTIHLTSCARGDTICPAPLLPVGAPVRRAPPSRRNVAVLSHAEYVPTLTAAAALRVKAALRKAAWWLWSFDLESGVWVTCDVGYLCANFGLPRPLCSRLRPDVCDRRQTASLLNAPTEHNRQLSTVVSLTHSHSIIISFFQFISHWRCTFEFITTTFCRLLSYTVTL